MTHTSENLNSTVLPKRVRRQAGGAFGWVLMAIIAIAVGAGGAIATFGDMWVR